ncbi:hypothetical protein AVEN_100879-1 [Araneus ventricosus]|uniref:Uncharacterized protein n=1 Tax=Araneus ventricosus TaxID=182803 RepID=A0A4Y2AWW3_ARAVE|nr:hypothetical protein AVEN_100879-1 [Araneus ventricosus]
MWQSSVEKVADNCAPVRWSPVLLKVEESVVSCGNNHNCNIPVTACSMKKKGPYSLVFDTAQKTFTFGESLSCSTMTCRTEQNTTPCHFDYNLLLFKQCSGHEVEETSEDAP